MNPIDRMVIKFRDVLAETERLPADKLKAYQENLLAPLLRHAYRNVPFYKDRLEFLMLGAGCPFGALARCPYFIAHGRTAEFQGPHG